MPTSCPAGADGALRRGRRCGDAYVSLSELVPHKHLDVAVEAFNRLRLPLVVVGDGPDERRLKRLAGPTIRFAGRLTDADTVRTLQRRRALVVTAKEEFGIAAVEAQAAGRPVIALDEGGVRDTVLEGVTGTFFPGPSPGRWSTPSGASTRSRSTRRPASANARRFDELEFRRGVAAVVERALAADRPPRPGMRRRPPRRARGLARPA